MIKWIIIGLYISKNVFDAIIEHLDNTYIDKELPENVRDVYSKEEYENWKNYNNDGALVADIKNYLNIGITLLFLIFNVYALFFNALGNIAEPIKYLFVLFAMECIMLLINIPFNYYDTFVIEEKYGLNKSTKKLFFIDQIKGLFLGVFLEYGILMLVYVLYRNFGNYAFIWTCLVFLGIILVMAAIILPIMKIFNKFTPLEEGELKDKLLELCHRYGVSIKKIVVKDASKRTTRANAFCSGYGKQKTISLDDNLLNGYSSEQIVAVFAHEFSHAREKHVLKKIPFIVINLLIVFGSLGLVLNYPMIYETFGFNGINYMFAMVILEYLMWPISKVLSIVSNYITRKYEYEADAFAAKEGYGDALIFCLKKLSKENLSDINPHPAVVWLEYSHPTLSQRIAAIEKVKINA